MPHPIYTKIAVLKSKLLERASADGSELLEVCEGLLALIEQNRADLTNAFEAQVKADQRLHALEKTAPGYEARG